MIASRVPGLMDVVGDSGMLFEPGNSQQLARYLNNLLDNPQLRMELIEKSRKRAQGFSIEHTADNYISLYKSVRDKMK